jgi:multidrug efflux system outer membrane protein
MNTMHRYAVPALVLLSVFIQGCRTGPDYERPDTSALVPTDWRWQPAKPADGVPKGPWWQVFQDPSLDRLEETAMADNQNLKVAVARIEQARSVARVARSQLFPTISASAGGRHERLSGNRPLPVPLAIPISPTEQKTHSLSLDVAYEVDLWGRIHRSLEAAGAQTQASEADGNNLLLSLTADVAVNYFALRAKDAEVSALLRAVGLRAISVHIQEERFKQQVVPEINVAAARTEWARAKVALAAAQRQRAGLFNALALLCGKAPANFSLPPAKDTTTEPVTVPAGLPASLLERRPDVAAAERRLAARNAQIGVAQAAYYPRLNLTGGVGLLSSNALDLVSADSAVWSVAAGLSQSLFNAGRTKAEVERAEAAYREALAQYRESLLVAFREVDDSLGDIHFLNQQHEAQQEALAYAQRTLKLEKDCYEAGTVDYLNVVAAEKTVRDLDRGLAQLRGARFAASVRLIKALGGGWEPRQSNTPDTSRRD